MSEKLKSILGSDGVEHNERLFETDKGIASLGDELFVSLSGIP